MRVVDDTTRRAETLRRAFHRNISVAPSDYRGRFRSTREQT
jgi:hypothetical protein